LKKIVSRPALLAKRRRWKAAGKKVVFTNGCFDLLHPGHVRLLRKAKSLGDVLVVGLNSDGSVRRLKGPARPVQAEAARAEVMAALEPVDAVTVFDEDTPAELLAALRPDVLVKGADYSADRIVGREHAGRVVRFPLVEGQSTSRLVDRMRKRPDSKEAR
jgi:D-beta-D-heptose 7-phosphate kinase/D-beta-D-heptose 1-phosphate adenosyltransferase